MLKQREVWTGWPRITVDDELRQLAASMPGRAYTANKTPSDLTNLMFLGSQQELTAAFSEAHWLEADDLGVRTAINVAQATIRQTGASTAPVSSLYINGKLPDLVFQKSLDTFAKRHHIRVWNTGKTYQGRQVWVGAATHDIGTSSSRAYTKWAHRIDPHIDRERDWVETDLLFVGTATAYADIDRPNAPRKSANATGDDLLTDGKISVVELARVNAPGGNAPALRPRPQAPVSKSAQSGD